VITWNYIIERKYLLDLISVDPDITNKKGMLQIYKILIRNKIIPTGRVEWMSFTVNDE